MKRWVSAVGFVACGALLSSTIAMARGVAEKWNGKLDVSVIEILRPSSDKVKSMDGVAAAKPKIPRDPVFAPLGAEDRFKLRAQIAALLGTKTEAVPEPRFALSFKQPGDTVTLRLHDPLIGSAVSVVRPVSVSSQYMYAPKSSSIQLFGKEGAAYFSINVEGGHTYLFTCYVSDSAIPIIVGVTDDKYPIWAYTHTSVQGDRFFAGFETSPDAGFMTLKVDMADQGPDFYTTIHACDVTYVR